MPFLKTTKTFKNSILDCEICLENFRTKVVGVFMDDGEWVEEYGLCDQDKCRKELTELTIGDTPGDRP